MAVALTLPSVVLRYLAWMTWPLSHSAYVIHPYVDTVASPRFWLAAVGLGAIATAAWRATRSSPQARRLQLLATMVVAGLSPLVGLWRPAGPADMGAMTAERFAYFPSFPFLALVACGLAYGLRSRAEPRRWAARVTVAVVLVAGTTATAARNRDWRDEKTFLDATLREAPTSTLLWGRLVQHHLERRDTDAAAAAIERARAAGAGGSALSSTEAHLLQQQGRIAEAIPLQERFVRSAHQARVPALNNLAYLYRLDGRTADAKEILEGLVADGSAYADVYANLAAVYRGEGDLDRARQAYRAALRDRPDHLRTAGALVSLEVEAGRPEAAARVYEGMLRYHPGNRRLRNNLGLLRAESGDDDGAAALFGALVATYPDYANARVNYAQVLFRLDRTAEAQSQLRAARPLVRGTELEAIVERQLDGATSQRE